MIRSIYLGETEVWLYIDPLRVVDDKTKHIKNKEKFLCYFRFTQPTPLFLGELIRDNKSPKLFDSCDDAINFAEKYIKERYDL